MKKIFISILIGAAAFSFADAPLTVLSSPEQLLNDKMPPQEMTVSKQGYFYLRFATADSDLVFANSLCPGLGLGYRRLANDGAIDISINGNGSSHYSKRLWTAPKVSYLRYLTPNDEKSAYIGAGLAWGGVDLERRRDFIGIIPSATFGFEFAHKSPLLGFAELNISQPAIPLKQRGRFPGPIAEFSIGAGF